MSVGRKYGVVVIARRLEKSGGLTVPFKRQHPDVILSLYFVASVENEFTIGRPTGWENRSVRLKQDLFLPGAAGQLSRKQKALVSKRCPGEVITIRRPNDVRDIRWSGSEP